MGPPAADETLDLVEVFASAQGEGPHVGASTVFVRLGRCDLRCAWCDSPETWLPPRRGRVEGVAGSGEFRDVDNPVPLPALLEWLDSLDAWSHRFVALTGGEPLLQPDAAHALARAIRERGGRVYLETHGLCVDAMQRIASDVDVVSMDWKLASDVRRESDPKGGVPAPFHDTHERFLRAAAAARETFVKVVVTPNTLNEELDEICDRIAHSAPDTLLVLQPVTPFAAIKQAPPPDRLLGWLRHCESRLPRVRLIPQTHKLYGAL